MSKVSSQSANQKTENHTSKVWLYTWGKWEGRCSLPGARYWGHFLGTPDTRMKLWLVLWMPLVPHLDPLYQPVLLSSYECWQPAAQSCTLLPEIAPSIEMLHPAMPRRLCPSSGDGPQLVPDGYQCLQTPFASKGNNFEAPSLSRAPWESGQSPVCSRTQILAQLLPLP